MGEKLLKKLNLKNCILELYLLMVIVSQLAHQLVSQSVSLLVNMSILENKKITGIKLISTCVVKVYGKTDKDKHFILVIHEVYRVNHILYIIFSYISIITLLFSKEYSYRIVVANTILSII